MGLAGDLAVLRRLLAEDDLNATDTFAGINPTSALPFIAAQLLGGGVGTALAIALFPNTSRVPD